MSDRSFLVALHSIGISQKKLMEMFLIQENYKEVWEVLDEKFLSSFYTDLSVRKKILEKKKELSFEKLERILAERQVRIMTFHDSNYPESIKNISHVPYFFYVRGSLDTSHKMALVGSRTMTSYGKKCIEDLIPDLSKYFTIVSGGATGCDSEAHLQTMKSGGKTIAVIGTGINVDYPASNKKLFLDIVQS
jgi:DNA processing protein